jgi:hypothetical protein
LRVRCFALARDRAAVGIGHADVGAIAARDAIHANSGAALERRTVEVQITLTGVGTRLPGVLDMHWRRVVVVAAEQGEPENQK